MSTLKEKLGEAALSQYFVSFRDALDRGISCEELPEERIKHAYGQLRVLKDAGMHERVLVELEQQLLAVRMRFLKGKMLLTKINDGPEPGRQRLEEMHASLQRGVRDHFIALTNKHPYAVQYKRELQAAADLYVRKLSDIGPAYVNLDLGADSAYSHLEEALELCRLAKIPAKRLKQLKARVQKSAPYLFIAEARAQVRKDLADCVANPPEVEPTPAMYAEDITALLARAVELSSDVKVHRQAQNVRREMEKLLANK